MQLTSFFILITILFHPFLAKASVDTLFLKSLNKSKQVEVIKLSEKKTLSELESRTTTLYPSLDVVNINRYGNKGIVSEANETEIDSQVALSLQHKLFQGGAEFSLNDYRKLLPKQARSQKEEELAVYYGQFSSLYFQVSSTMEESEKISALLKNLKQRVKIVKQRTKIGRDRKADLFALESQLFRLEADLYSSQVRLETAKTEFFNFSGLPASAKVSDTTNPLNLNLMRNVNLEERPGLKNLKLGADASELEAKMEKSSYYPQVDLGANYYLDKSSLGRNDWDVSLNIRLNLFDFGQRSANVQTKKVTASISRARFDYARLNAKRSWNSFVENFKTKKRELSSLKNALKRSRTSYTEQLKDLKRGLVTQIDVIRSLDDVIGLEKLFIKSSLEVKSLYYQANAYLGNYPKG